MSRKFSLKISSLVIISCFFGCSTMAPVEAPNPKEYEQTTTRPSLTSVVPVVPYSVVDNGKGTVYEWQSDTITVRLTGAQTQGLFTLTEDLMKPTFTLGRHLHRTHAETFHMLDGEVEFSVGSEKRVLRPGGTLHVPPNIPHAVRVLNGRPARMLMLYAPAGFDQFLAEMKMLSNAQLADEQLMKKLNEKYDIIQLE